MSRDGPGPERDLGRSGLDADGHSMSRDGPGPERDLAASQQIDHFKKGILPWPPEA
jgi:hypothetical protein